MNILKNICRILNPFISLIYLFFLPIFGEHFLSGPYFVSTQYIEVERKLLTSNDFDKIFCESFKNFWDKK